MPTNNSPSLSEGKAVRLVVVTGLSGAGKSAAIRALEDLGYLCVDNLPAVLIPTLANLAAGQGSLYDAVAVALFHGRGLRVSLFAGGECPLEVHHER